MSPELFDKAKKNKADEFYTQLPDIEAEMRHYKEQFLGKVIFCNCDDPYESNFFKYFALNFNSLGLKKLIVTGFSGSTVAYQQLALFDVKSLHVKDRNVKLPYKIEISAVEDQNADGALDLADVEVPAEEQEKRPHCQFVCGDFSIDYRAFHNLTNTEREQIYNYTCMIYFCEGNDREKLDWFRIVNIAGERLSDQELRNAVYTGPWLTSAKSIFSKTNCAAYGLAKDYVNGSPIRQEFLETALSWITHGEIENYMSIHQHDPNANELWIYFMNVVEWVKLTFPKYRKEMKGLDWGTLHAEFKDKIFDTAKLELEIQKLMMDDDVTNKRGAYLYVLTRTEKYLSIRAFSESQKRAAYERQQGICPVCGLHFELCDMEADHITPWHLGGKTLPENCKMLCKDDNRRKAGI